MLENIKLAYIGGGSKQWAWTLMSDLALCEELSGEVRLYDIDKKSAEENAAVGNSLCEGWKYKAVSTLDEAMTGADFVIISILPGTFDEMESDVHAPEKYGIFQSVGDTTGPGGILRGLRSIPMLEKIALEIKKSCPDAWVINYTNPMAICLAALYDAFPEIKAFGCCHEIFNTQTLLMDALKEEKGIEAADRSEIKVNPIGVNHFTWLTEARYEDIDLFPLYESFAKRHIEKGYIGTANSPWINTPFFSLEKVKMDLFLNYGYIAAAGDRHLAEFCPQSWYLDRCKDFGFTLTSVAWRKEDMKIKLEKREAILSGKAAFDLKKSGEEGVAQIKALLGLSDLTTNVNLHNTGQIPNLPIGAIVETNALFSKDKVVPVQAGNVPDEILPLISRSATNQLLISKAGKARNLETAYLAFKNDILVNLSPSESKALFDEMIYATKAYLTEY